MFNVRPLFLDKDYATLKVWWEQWGWKPFPQMFLPQNGVVVEHDNNMVCAVFLYLTDTPIIWMENYISDKEKKPSIRSQALYLMIEEAKEKAKRLGANMVMSSVNHAGLARKLRVNGFKKADDGLTNYVGVL